MNKLQIKIVLIGHADRIIDLKVLRKFKSQLFAINQFEHIAKLPPPQKSDGFLDVVYSRKEVARLLEPVQCADICVGLINYPFDDNFYMHRVGDNKMCISLAKVDTHLIRKDISLENFVVNCIYKAIVYYRMFGNITDDRMYHCVHLDTRGCLFDLNGDQGDVIYNTESPIVCEECKETITRALVPAEFIDIVCKELKSIRKPWIKSVELFIRTYPLVSIVTTFVFSTLINLFSSFIWDSINK